MIDKLLIFVAVSSLSNLMRPNKLEEHPSAERDLSFQGYLKEREYLIKSEDESERQLDQLIFYISSAAIGLTVTQLSSTKSYLELVPILFAAVAFVFTVFHTYSSIRLSARLFESLRNDATAVTKIPYVFSESTKKLEIERNFSERLQHFGFCTGLFFLVIFSIGRVVTLISPEILSIQKQESQKSYLVNPSEVESMTDVENSEQAKEKQETNKDTNQSKIREYSLKPKDPPPIKPVDIKPTKTEKK